MREVVCDFLVGDNLYRSTPEVLDNYFLAFAVAVRRNRWARGDVDVRSRTGGGGLRRVVSAR
jgi:hypothetical protein